MYKHTKKRLAMYFIILFGIIIIGVLSLSNNQEIPKSKTLIIFAEALPNYIVSPNLEDFPAINQLCVEGICTKIQPALPTFTTMQNFVLEIGQKSDKAAYAYNFVIDGQQFKEGNCKFIGEINDLAFPKQKRLNDIMLHKGVSVINFVPNGSLTTANDVFATIPGLLKNNEVVRTYITDTDSHYINLTNVGSKSDIVEQFKDFDKKLSSMLNDLKKQALYDSTTIILYGDHGMASINKFYFLPQIITDLEENIDLSNVCYWNDAGTSLRFWINENNNSKKEHIINGVNSYFSDKSECFFTADDDFMKQNDLFFEDSDRRWINFGDVHIGVNVGCKINTQEPSGGMESGFAEQQSRVDKFFSMHGYLDKDDIRLQAFLAIKPAKSKKNDAILDTGEITFIELREYILDLFKENE